MGILEKNEFSREKLDLEEALMFNKFVHTTVDRLNAVVDCPVHLVFSHGDFCPANFLSSKDGLKIIDWESAGFRSLLFDFYSYFFHRPVSSNLPIARTVSEINEALSYFISELSLVFPDIADNLLASVETYRNLFYIEQLCRLVKRDLTDKHLSMKDYIFRYIKAFQACEDIFLYAYAKTQSEYKG
ncbi:MAG: phosphotransferase [Planctomycetia bacterium]|nr:phosphotransferase [Planctomycetia bacterium]